MNWETLILDRYTWGRRENFRHMLTRHAVQRNLEVSNVQIESRDDPSDVSSDSLPQDESYLPQDEASWKF